VTSQKKHHISKDTIEKLQLIFKLIEISKGKSIFEIIRRKPIIQLLGLANDIVEPLVTFTELAIILDQKLGKHQKVRHVVQTDYGEHQYGHHGHGLGGYPDGLAYGQQYDLPLHQPTHHEKHFDEYHDNLISSQSRHAPVIDYAYYERKHNNDINLKNRFSGYQDDLGLIGHTYYTI